MATLLPYLCGKRYGRLTVIDLAERQDGYWYWDCICDCGNATRVMHGSLVFRDNTRSCGCLMRERAAETSTKHGKHGTPEYFIWYAMIARCTKPKCQAYKDYGGRGISVCVGWSTFIGFSADVGQRPSPLHTLDRTDNNGGYWCGHCNECVANNHPTNWRWATRKEQSLNRRVTRYITADGETLRLDQWAERLNSSVEHIRTRIKRGWPEDKAVTTPLLSGQSHRKGQPRSRQAWE